MAEFMKGTGNEFVLIDNTGEIKKSLRKLIRQGLREASAVIEKDLKKQIPKRLRRLENHVGVIMTTDSKTKQPKCKTGFYSWQKVKKMGERPSHTSPYWVENGTKPHVIDLSESKIAEKKGTKAMGPNGIYGSKVNHPGQRAQHVLRDAFLHNYAEVREIQERTLGILSQEIDKVRAQTKEIPDDEPD